MILVANLNLMNRSSITPPPEERATTPPPPSHAAAQTLPKPARLSQPWSLAGGQLSSDRGAASGPDCGLRVGGSPMEEGASH